MCNKKTTTNAMKIFLFDKGPLLMRATTKILTDHFMYTFVTKFLFHKMNENQCL